MAMQTVTVKLTAQASATFTFPTPAGNYGKTVGLNITDGGGDAVANFAADSASAGTTTGTLTLSAAVTGTAEITVYDHA